MSVWVRGLMLASGFLMAGCIRVEHPTTDPLDFVSVSNNYSMGVTHRFYVRSDDSVTEFYSDPDNFYSPIHLKGWRRSDGHSTGAFESVTARVHKPDFVILVENCASTESPIFPREGENYLHIRDNGNDHYLAAECIIRNSAANPDADSAWLEIVAMVENYVEQGANGLNRLWLPRSESE